MVPYDPTYWTMQLAIHLREIYTCFQSKAKPSSSHCHLEEENLHFTFSCYKTNLYIVNESSSLVYKNILERALFYLIFAVT